MEDDKSTATSDVPVTPDEPATDPIALALSDTEDEGNQVVETPKEEPTDAEIPPEADPEEQEDIPADQPEEPLDPKEQARRYYEERQRQRAERETSIRQQNQEYLDGAENDTDQRVRAIELQTYINTVQANNEQILSEFERAKANPDLQIFNPDSEQFNQKAYDKMLKDYNAGYLDYDQHNNIVGIKGSLYEHLTETAELLQGAVKSGAIQQVRATRQMKSNADVKPAAPPKAAEKDAVLDILLSD